MDYEALGDGRKDAGPDGDVDIVVVAITQVDYSNTESACDLWYSGGSTVSRETRR